MRSLKVCWDPVWAPGPRLRETMHIFWGITVNNHAIGSGVCYLQGLLVYLSWPVVIMPCDPFHTVAGWQNCARSHRIHSILATDLCISFPCETWSTNVFVNYFYWQTSTFIHITKLCQDKIFLQCLTVKQIFTSFWFSLISRWVN